MNIRERHAIKNICLNAAIGHIKPITALKHIKEYVMGKRQIVKTCHNWKFSHRTIADWETFLNK